MEGHPWNFYFREDRHERSATVTRQRLQKLIASAGVCSRRKAEDLLRDRRVRVNGQLATLGDQADLDVDTIEVGAAPGSCLADYLFTAQQNRLGDSLRRTHRSGFDRSGILPFRQYDLLPVHFCALFYVIQNHSHRFAIEQL